MDISTLKDHIDTEVARLITEIDEFVKASLAKIEEAKNNEILAGIRGLSTRLDAIEARLPDPEED